MDFEALSLDLKENVATIMFNRPERMNALNATLRREIVDAMGVCDEDPEVRAVVLTGAGRGFCSGADLGGRPPDAVPETWGGVGPVGGLGRMVMAVRNCKKPTIAAVNGAAAGAGLAIALACDIRIVSDQARFAAIFVKRGIMPDSGSTFLLPQAIRLDYALKMLLTGDIFGAAEADRMGLCTELVSHDQLLARASELGGQFARGAGLAMGYAKRSTYQNLYGDLAGTLTAEDHYVSLCNVSEDQAEGVKAFLEKREPVFRGR